MPIDARAVPYGRTAVELLATQVAELKRDDRLGPVTVIVASNHVAVATRRALAAQPGGIANVAFLTLDRLAERFGAATLAAAGRRPVSAPVIGAAMRAALAEKPGVFAPVADHPATEHALASAHRELRAVPEAALDAVADCSTRASDVVRLYRAVREQLTGGWFDEEDLLVAAAEALRTGAVAGTGALIAHLLPDLTAGQADLLHTLGTHGPVAVNVGVTGDLEADRPVREAYARAGIPVPDPGPVEPPCATRIVSASDPDDEVRAAVRLVTQCMHDGVRLGRIAIVWGNASPYARLVHEQLTAAGIPMTGAPVRALGDMLLGRTLRALLALPDRGFRRQDLLGVLTSAPLLDGDEPVPSRVWAQLSRDAGVVAGDDWSARLALFAEQLRAPVEGEDDELRLEQRRRDADRADALADYVARLREQLARGHQGGSWSGLTAWAHGLVDAYLGGEAHRRHLPAAEQQARTDGSGVMFRLSRRFRRVSLPAP